MSRHEKMKRLFEKLLNAEPVYDKAGNRWCFDSGYDLCIYQNGKFLTVAGDNVWKIIQIADSLDEVN